MTYEEAVNRLEFHSYLKIENEDKITSKQTESLDYALYSLQFKNIYFDFDKCFIDIIDCLSVVNIHLNGLDSEKIAFNNKAKIVDRRMVCSIQKIIQGIQRIEIELRYKKSDDKILNILLKLRFVISECWLNILEGGDFSEINKELVEPSIIYLNTMLNE